MNIITHDEYMGKIATISISPFHLIRVSNIIPLWMILCTNLEISKPSMQHVIKETTFDKMYFLYNLSTRLNKSLEVVVS